MRQINDENARPSRKVVRFIGIDMREFERQPSPSLMSLPRLTPGPTEEAADFLAHCLANNVLIEAFRNGSAPPFEPGALKPALNRAIERKDLTYPDGRTYANSVNENLGIDRLEAIADDSEAMSQIVIIVDRESHEANEVAALQNHAEHNQKITLIIKERGASMTSCFESAKRSLGINQAPRAHSVARPPFAHQR